MAKGDGSDGGDGKGNNGNDNSNDQNQNQDQDQDSGVVGNDGFEGGRDNDNGGGDDSGDKGEDSNVGQGRRDAATTAFGEDEGKIAGKPGSTTTTTAGQDKSADEKSETSEESRGVVGSITDALSHGYQAVTDSLASMMGFGKDISEENAKEATTSFAKGLLADAGIVNPVQPNVPSPMWTVHKVTPNVTHHAPVATPKDQIDVNNVTGARKALNATTIENMDLSNTVGSGLGLASDKFAQDRLTTDEKRAYDQVRNASLSSSVSSLAKTALSGLGVPGLISEIGVRATNIGLAQKRAQELGLDVKGGRRNSAVSAFSGASSSNVTDLSGTSNLAQKQWQWHPSSYGLGNYGSHVKGLLS